MIKIDFTFAVAAFLIFDLILVIALWVSYTCNERASKDVHGAQYVQQCPYCCFVFFDYRKSSLQTCPQCKSLIERGSQKV
jgi:hypothetical protein